MTSSEDQEYMWVLGLEGGGDADRSRFFRRSEARLGRDRVPVEQLQRNVETFVHAMGRAIETVPAVLSGFSIDSIEISAEVSASGTVSLLGSGGEVHGHGEVGGSVFMLVAAVGV